VSKSLLRIQPWTDNQLMWKYFRGQFFLASSPAVLKQKLWV